MRLLLATFGCVFLAGCGSAIGEFSFLSKKDIPGLPSKEEWVRKEGKCLVMVPNFDAAKRKGTPKYDSNLGWSLYLLEDGTARPGSFFRDLKVSNSSYFIGIGFFYCTHADGLALNQSLE
jgi:hypothetical protein